MILMIYSTLGLFLIGFFLLAIGDAIVEKAERQAQWNAILSKRLSQASWMNSYPFGELHALPSFNRPVFNEMDEMNKTSAHFMASVHPPHEKQSSQTEHCHLLEAHLTELEHIMTQKHRGLESSLLLKIVMWTMFWWISSAVIFTLLEKDWTWLDGFYFTFTTMTTIGYGDVQLRSPMSWEFWYFFIFQAVSLLIFCFEGLGHDLGYRIHLWFGRMYVNAYKNQ
jgi:hypothetical protein